VAPVNDSGRLRIVQVVLDLEAGGLERMVADLIRRLDPDRFELHLLALRHLGRYAEGLDAFCTPHLGARTSPTVESGTRWPSHPGWRACPA